MVKLIAGLVVLVALVASNLLLLSETTRLKARAKQSAEVEQKMRDETRRLQEESAGLSREYEALQSDVVSYVGVNTDLRKELDDKTARLEEAQERITDKDEELQQMLERLQNAQTDIEELRRELARKKSEEAGVLREELGALQQEKAALTATLERERALFQYNLGVVYAQVGRYDEALEAYDQSVRSDPNNPDAHYNLGLLYEKVREDPEQAVRHYRRYLELNPAAKDRTEVQGWIDALTAAPTR